MSARPKLMTENRNGVLRIIRKEDRQYYVATDVMELLGVAENKAYLLIRALRKELADSGYFINEFTSGRIPKRYFNERCGISSMEECNYYKVEEVMELVGVSKPKAYQLMHALRDEFIASGGLISEYPCGRIPVQYFNEHCGITSRNECNYYRVNDVMEILGVSQSKAYRLMRILWEKLVASGRLNSEYPCGRVPKKYFKFYCYID